MKVIVLKQINKLQEEGSVVEVKDGYARNYLIPKGYALPVTESNLKYFNALRELRKKSLQAVAEKAKNIKQVIEGLSLTITAQAKNDEEIYGSINETHILHALESEGVDIQSLSLSLDEPLRKLGAYTVPVMLPSQLEAKLRVWIVKK